MNLNDFFHYFALFSQNSYSFSKIWIGFKIYSSASRIMQQLLLDITPKSPPTLDNFIVGNSNQVTFNAIKDLPLGQAIYIWGQPGCGRSHLLKAKAKNGYYLSSSSDLKQFYDLADSDKDQINLIAVDDIDNLTQDQQAVLFTIFNKWRDCCNTDNAFALLCAGNYAPLNLSLREDLRTRLGWGLVLKLDHLSDEERSIALQKRATALGLILSNEVLNWILTHYERDMRNLVALLDALDTYSLEQHRAITLPLLKDLLDKSPRRSE